MMGLRELPLKVSYETFTKLNNLMVDAIAEYHHNAEGLRLAESIRVHQHSTPSEATQTEAPEEEPASAPVSKPKGWRGFVG